MNRKKKQIGILMKISMNKKLVKIMMSFLCFKTKDFKTFVRNNFLLKVHRIFLSYGERIPVLELRCGFFLTISSSSSQLDALLHLNTILVSNIWRHSKKLEYLSLLIPFFTSFIVVVCC